jgi:beta-hydroxyacyl-ACP dehydratase FabZ
MTGDIRQIMSILPHRYPMLLVDRITELEPGKRACGYKNITANEPFFSGHFPGNPVFPGVFMIEALAQLGGMIIMLPGDATHKTPYLVGVEKARFRSPVVPGDCLRMETTFLKARSGVGWVAARASVDGKVVCDANLMYTIVESPAPSMDAAVLRE